MEGGEEKGQSSSLKNMEGGEDLCDLFYLISRDDGGVKWMKIYSAHGDRRKGKRSMDLKEVASLGMKELRLPMRVGIFSIGNLIYIVGGWYPDVNWYLDVSNRVYVYDTTRSTLISNDTRINPSMRFPKSDPIVVGPLPIPTNYSRGTGTGYYVFSADLAEHDMEVFELVGDEGFWTTIEDKPPTPYRSRLKDDQFSFRNCLYPTLVEKYAVVKEIKRKGRKCDVYIVLSTRVGEIFAFNVDRFAWKFFPKPNSTEAKLFMNKFGLSMTDQDYAPEKDEDDDSDQDQDDAPKKDTAWRCPGYDFVPANDAFCWNYLLELRECYPFDEYFYACLPIRGKERTLVDCSKKEKKEKRVVRKSL